MAKASNGSGHSLEEVARVARGLLILAGRRPPRDADGILKSFVRCFGEQDAPLTAARASEELARVRRRNLQLLVTVAEGVAPLARQLKHRSHATLWRWLNSPGSRLGSRSAMRITASLGVDDDWLDRSDHTLASVRRDVGSRLRAANGG